MSATTLSFTIFMGTGAIFVKLAATAAWLEELWFRVNRQTIVDGC